MEKSIFELAIEELLERQKLTKVELRKRFKGAKPFGMEKVPDEQRIMDYQEMMDNPDILQQFEQSMPPEEVQMYHSNMHELINKKLMGGQNA